MSQASIGGMGQGEDWDGPTPGRDPFPVLLVERVDAPQHIMPLILVGEHSARLARLAYNDWGQDIRFAGLGSGGLDRSIMGFCCESLKKLVFVLSQDLKLLRRYGTGRAA